MGQTRHDNTAKSHGASFTYALGCSSSAHMPRDPDINVHKGECFGPGLLEFHLVVFQSALPMGSQKCSQRLTAVGIAEV